MGRTGAGRWAMVLGTAVAIVLAVLLALKLGGALPGDEPVRSTLDGGVVTDERTGWSIREADLAEVPGYGGGEFPRFVPLDDRRILFEAGGSGSADCASNFSGIAFADGTLRLSHREGDGGARVCTDDYRFTYFEIRAAGATDLHDVRRITTAEGSRGGSVYISDDWTSGSFEIVQP